MNFLDSVIIFVTVVISLNFTPSLAIFGIDSEDLGRHLCFQFPANHCDRSIIKPGTWRDVLKEHTYRNITSPRIRIKAEAGFGFNVRFKNGDRFDRVREFFMMGEGTEVDIELSNSSTNLAMSCLSYVTPSKVNSSILMSANASFRIMYSSDKKYPDLHMISAFEVFGRILQSGRFTCHGSEQNFTETLRIFTQPSIPNGTSPFVTHNDIVGGNPRYWDRPELTIQKDKTGNGFIVPCRTNYRVEMPPFVLWKKRFQDDLTMLTDEEMKSFGWDPSVGFRFDRSDRSWEMGFLACRFGAMEKLFLPTASRFEATVFVTAKGNKIRCAIGSRNQSSSLVASHASEWKARYFQCQTLMECEMSIQVGLILYERSYREFLGTPSDMKDLNAEKTCGVLSCILDHDYEEELVPEISLSKFFTGLDSNVYLLPGYFPNSSVIQISLVDGPFYKYQTDLYHEITCTTINFVISEQVFLIIRHGDLSGNVSQHDIGPRHAGIIYKTQFNVSLNANMTHAVCLALTQDGKVVSAERRLKIFDARELYIENAPTSFKTFQVGDLQDDLTLVCPITGVPQPEYRWLFNENKTDLVQGANSRNLTFLQIHGDIPGNYTCEAWNQDGYKSFEFKVDVQNQDASSLLSHTTVAGIGFGVALSFVLLVTAAALAFKYFDAKRELRNLTPEEVSEFLNGSPNLDEASNAEGNELALLLPFTKCIKPSNLSVARDMVLGKGAYGIVYRGTLHSEVVAVKTFKQNVTYEEFRAGLVEVKLMNFVGEHPNIVRFIGANVTNIQRRDILIVMELSPFGSLEKHLRLLKPSIQPDYVNTERIQDESVNDRLTLKKLFSFCEQIASAMDHLEKKKVVHGDLAARNVLVFNDGVVKVTDFGYSRQLYENNMYKPKKNRALPWRWASIELLRDLEFSTESDIWAFGVTVWEIFTFGNVPFASEKWSERFMDSLQNGLRLVKPSGLSESQYCFLKECWNVDKSARPRFPTLKDFFS